MGELLEPVVVKLDRTSCEPQKPHAVITADCSGAHEFDDAIHVEQLDADRELYKVSVFAVDTSSLYFDGDVLKRVLRSTESRYGTAPDGSSLYSPMLDSGLTQRLHFAKGGPRRALVVSFMVGAAQAPTTPEVSFGQVEVTRNYQYNKFGAKCRYSDTLRPYGRAAAQILRHLNLAEEDTDEEAVYNGLIHVPKGAEWQRGAAINQTFMVAANHLVGQLMRDEGHLAIYRVHDTESDHLLEAVSPTIARYSTVPSPHAGLGLDVYCRVTSPLRRAEDFIMHGLLRVRDKGRTPDRNDQRQTAVAVQRLNQRVISEQFYGPLRTSQKDVTPHKTEPRRALLQEIA